jgi:hypothetical protein
MEESDWATHVPMSKVAYHAAELPQLGLHQAFIKLGLDYLVFEFASAIVSIMDDPGLAPAGWPASGS